MNRETLIVFDCDGVLVDSEPLAAIAFESAYRRHGMSITRDMVSQCIGMKQADIILRIRDISGHHFPAGSEADIWEETKLLFTEKLQAMAGIRSFLDHLPNPRCVASSSSPERIRHSLAVTGLADAFGNAIYSSSMVTRGKPAPDLFLHAAAEMDFEPGACAVIEDSPFGIEGAVAAGMTAIGFTGGGHSDEGHSGRLNAAGAHTVCATWDQVARELGQRGFLRAAA